MRAQSIFTILTLSLLGLVLQTGPATAQPSQVSYQGLLEANGQPYTGAAGFKFAIVSGGVTLWSHDASSTVGDEPTSSLTLTANQGAFSVRLGDTNSGQSPLDAWLLGQTNDAALRVWVDTGAGFEQLSDQPLSSSPFALQAQTATGSIGDFGVQGSLFVGSEVQVGSVLRFPDDTTMATAASGGGGPDNDWVVAGNDLYSAPSGNVGIGTASPLHRLHVAGTARYDLGGGRIELNTPGGWPGFIGYSANGNRRDLIVDDTGLRILVSDSAGAPAAARGLVMDQSGHLGINKVPAQGTNLDVLGKIKSDEFALDEPGYDVVQLWGSAAEGGEAAFYGGGGVNDPGVSIQGAGTTGGGILDLYNGAGNATIDLQGDQAGAGAIYVGNGSGLSAAIDGAGGKLQAYNSLGTLTYQAAGQAYASGSQTRMYDANGALAQEWTASNREWKALDANGTTQIRTFAETSGGELFLYQKDGHPGVVLDGDNGGDGEISVYDQSGVRTVQILGQDAGGNGRIITDVLEIQGGADLSESFDVNADQVEPGMVVCIDPTDAGKLVVSDTAYARTVAGIVSGAGGVRPGMLMAQQGSIADGAHPVALTGRVWTWCDSSAGSIQPGDLLTTSDVPGHAMRASDHDRAQGAVIGKAMSSLPEGRGMVLVLVSLQ